jgi:hypothetical protein
MDTSELFELTESDSRAVCVDLSLLQCSVLDELLALKRKHKLNCLHCDEFTTLYQPS